MKNIFKFFVLIILILISANFLNAQYGSFGATNAQLVGTGNILNESYSVLGIGINPAYLAIAPDTNNYITIQFPNISFKAIESSMTLEDFNKYFNYPKAKYLTDAEKAEFFNKFEDENGFYFNLGSTVFAIAAQFDKNLGTFGLSSTDYLAGTSNVPLTLIDLLINGNQKNKVYKFDDFSFKMWWIRSYSLSWAKQIFKFDDNSFIKSINAGITAKYYNGFAYAGIDKFSANLHTGENNELTGHIDYLAQAALSTDLGNEYEFENVKYSDNTSFFNKPSGSGFGFDIGFSALLSSNLTVGIAITDIGSINWDNHVAEYKANGDIYIDDLLDEEQRNELENFIEDSSYAINNYSTNLPTALRFNLSYKISQAFEHFPGNMSLHFGYNQGFNDNPGNTITPRFAFGIFWETLPYLPIIMTGLSNNRAGDIAWSFGLGYNTSIVDFAISTQNLLNLVSNSNYPHVSAALNFIWKFEL